jgi:hypothetical protein
MSKSLIPGGIIKHYEKMMRQVIFDLSKCIIVYTDPIKYECPNCEWDVVHQKSAGVRRWKPITSCVTIFSGTDYEATYCESDTGFNRSRCPVCHGEGQLIMPDKVSLEALVTWQFTSSATTQGNKFQRPIYWPAGLENKHACRIKTHSCHFDLIKNAKHFEVDGYNMLLWNDPNLEGLGGRDGILIAYLIDMQEEFIPK